jgi:hypothetical protein
MGGDTRTFPYDSIKSKLGGYFNIENVYSVFNPDNVTDTTQYILLVAHYDSRFRQIVRKDTVYSYGAADDGYGVGVILETVSQLIKERDEWKRKHDEAIAEHTRQQEEREFDSDLEAAITEAKGKNPKAIKALLDLEKLRSSKNRKADTKTALDSLRTESGYLFDDNGGGAQFTDPKGNGGAGGTVTKKDIMAIKDPVERQAKIAANIHLFQKG